MNPQDSQSKLKESLRTDVITEFKQVLRLAPADYTENCTNVVMSLIEAYVTTRVKEAELRAQLGIIEYYDQIPDNQSVDWKGLLSDSRKQIEYELTTLTTTTNGKEE